jgi:uncharacterized protein
MVNRDLAPDVLRGFALLGIVLVNVAYFANDSETGITSEALAGAGNWLAGFLVWMLAQGKFYLLFSVLFGYSSHYVIKGLKSNRRRWVVRAVGLIILGAIHFTLLWHGDILFAYGVLGLMLTLFLFLTDRALKVWAWIFYLVFTIILSGLSVLIWFFESSGELVQVYNPVALNTVMQGGTYLESIPARFDLWLSVISFGIFLQGGYVFMMFLAGVYLARHKALSGGFLNNKKLMLLGFGLGLPLQGLSAWIGVNNQALDTPLQGVYLGSVVFGFATAPLVTFGFIGLFLYLVENKAGLISWMAYAGRMSLTTYLLQSVFLSLIFGPWGLGLFRNVDYFVAVLISILVWLILVGFARIWLSRFSQGPFEVLLTGFSKRYG